MRDISRLFLVHVATSIALAASTHGCGTSSAGVLLGSIFDAGSSPDTGPATGSAVSSPDASSANGSEISGSVVAISNTPPPSPRICTATGSCVSTCGNAGETTISGTVFDPRGRDPLYDVAVFVPSITPNPIAVGASCGSCEEVYSGNPITSALTDPSGHFQLANVPDGADVPLVVQVGKWRMQFVIPSVLPCTDNPIPDGTLHLPRNQMEGDIPNIAISTGGADSIECLFQRVGIDPTEFVGGSGGKGRIHIYAGSPQDQSYPANTSPPGPASYTALWDSVADLMQFDVVVLSCEGAETLHMRQQNLLDYVNSGGRVFASHYHYAWFIDGPFAQDDVATWSRGTDDDDVAAVVETTYMGSPFPKGQAMHDWLGNVGALVDDELPILQARHNADIGPANEPASVPWITSDTAPYSAGANMYFSFDTPVRSVSGGDGGAASKCGRVVFSDMHVGGASGDYEQATFSTQGFGRESLGAVVPSDCADNPLSPQEQALEFMIFDIATCAADAKAIPLPPVSAESIR